MNITVKKEHEGKTIYGIGTGNNCPRGGITNVPVEFNVVKVKRKYVEMSVGSSRYTDNYHPKTGSTQQSINTGYSNNQGYMFFESLQDIEEYKALNKIRSAVFSYFRDMNPILSEDQARGIHAILFRR